MRNIINVFYPWNNGKSGAKLDLTSSTTTGLQIHKFDHTRTANPCDWLPCRRATLLLVGCPHSLVYLHLPVVEGLIFCISPTPHLGTSFPLFHDITTDQSRPPDQMSTWPIQMQAPSLRRGESYMQFSVESPHTSH